MAGRDIVVVGASAGFPGSASSTLPHILSRTAARSYGPRVIGVILAGNLNDGTAGLITTKQRGGIAMVRKPLMTKVASRRSCGTPFYTTTTRGIQGRAVGY